MRDRFMLSARPQVRVSILNAAHFRVPQSRTPTIIRVISINPTSPCDCIWHTACPSAGARGHTQCGALWRAAIAHARLHLGGSARGAVARVAAAAARLLVRLGSEGRSLLCFNAVQVAYDLPHAPPHHMYTCLVLYLSALLPLGAAPGEALPEWPQPRHACW